MSGFYHVRRRPTVYRVTIELSRLEYRILRQLAREWVPRGEVKARASYELRRVLCDALEAAEYSGVNVPEIARRFGGDG
jgi:hypothetical protein